MPDYDVKVEPPKPGKDEPEWMRKGEKIAAKLDENLGRRFWTLVVIVAGGLIFGTPHILGTYRCHGECTRERAFECEYLGIRGVRAAKATDQGCAPFRLM